MRSKGGLRVAGTVAGLVLLVHSVAAGQVDSTRSLSERPANLEVEGETLLEALRLLQVSSGVPIGFSPETVPAGPAVRCDCAESTVAEALEILLGDTELTFAERRSQILVVPRTDPGPETRSAIVRGVVRQEGNGPPVRSARIELREHRLATLTDAAGRFTLGPVPRGPYHLDVDALGFRSIQGLSAIVGGPTSTILTVELTPNPLALAEVIVSPGTFAMLEDVALFPQTLTRQEMDALPQLGEDVFRAMERMPGVATDDISAKMSVRGGHHDELLIMLDGAELFEPYHMKDLDSVVGVVDVATLRGVSLVAGGLPTEHGGRMAGLLDMRTEQPIGSGTRNSFGLSASNVTFRTQGEFGDGRGGWLVSGRRGFLDLVLAMAAATEGGDNTNDSLSPRYFDVMGKVELLPASGHRLSAHVLYAGDDLSLSVFDGPLDRGSLRTDWTNLNVWAGWDWTPGERVDVGTVLSWADLKRRRSGEDLSPGRSEAADFAEVDDRADFGAFTARQDWRLALSRAAVLKLGGQVRKFGSDYRYFSTVGHEFLETDGSIGVRYDTTDVSLDPSTVEANAYLAARLQPVDRLTLEVGARYDRRSHTGDSDVSPRLHAAIDVGPATTVRASWGAHRQSHGVDELSVVDGDTVFFPSELAKQVAVGVQHRFGSGVTARVEAYHRGTADPRPRYLNVIREIIPFPEVGNGRVRFHPDEGRARGVELFASGPLGSRSDWTATYVLAQADDRVDSAWIPRTLDQRHTTSLRWHFVPNDRWQISATWQYHTGWPSTPMEFDVDTIPGAGPNDRDLLITESPGAINSRRLPAYHRMDLRATRTFNVGRGRLRVFLDVFNLYNRRNLRSFDYKVALPEGTVIANTGETLLPLLPSFGFTWEF